MSGKVERRNTTGEQWRARRLDGDYLRDHPYITSYKIHEDVIYG